MATSEPSGPAGARRSPLGRWFDSVPHYAGSAAGLTGLAGALAAGAGLWAVAAVGGLYAAGALVGWLVQDLRGRGSRPVLPATGPDPQLLRELESEVGRRAEQVAAAGWPAAAARQAGLLLAAAEEVVRRAGPGAGARASVAVREWVPEPLDWYERALCWWRLEPLGEDPGVEFAARVERALARLAAL
ncbi:hypothetical protein C7C46_02895 [Streptomyces tateyamensis]|uniref:Uncharacterized protein n=1 Tax=Streptomyces tateyamensis TaxID=565073 RepID=A0A2V4PA45_9ACTN|nr:hypothetical protein [Streptomyces tateyamensis]PYC87713.1 hypothetical protein C7C46_02895 [Streptomyces tateyamensis]